MNCEEFWSTAPQRAVKVSGEHAAHLAECAGCARLWQRHRELAAGLHLMAAEFHHEHAPARVEAGLVAAFRAQSRHGRRAAASMFFPVLAWVSAAAAMVAIGTVLMHGWQPDRTPRGPVAAPHRTVIAGPELARFVAGPADDLEGDDNTSGLGDGFIRLPNALPLEANEDINLVRVEVSPGQLVALGFTVSEDRAADPVLAEFAFGPDGTARAVRLVAEGGGVD